MGEHRKKKSPTKKRREPNKNAQIRQQRRQHKHQKRKPIRVVQLLLQNLMSLLLTFVSERLSKHGNTKLLANSTARRLILVRRMVLAKLQVGCVPSTSWRKCKIVWC